MEEQNLQRTLDALKLAHTKLNSKIESKDASYKELRQYMVEHNRNLDKMEIFDYQQTLRVIDKQGYAQVMERMQVEKLIDSPYFGAFRFAFEGEADSEAQTYYIGRFGFEDEGGNALIYDWRAPICHMYYEFELGAAYYEALDRRFDGELLAKKQIKIEQSKIQFVLDSSLTIQDEILQQTLSQQTNDKMKTIVTSIQKEQNKIVRNESASNVIIQGVAGSGKTAVALHRIAYYLYKFRDTLKPERIFILSPNKVFGDYISTVLPELGEQPIRAFTIDELTTVLLPAAVTFTPFEEETRHILQQPASALAKRAKRKADFAFLETLKAYLTDLDETLLKDESITIAEVPFTAEYLRGRFLQYKHEPVTTRLQLIVDDIVRILKAKQSGTGLLPMKGEILKRLKKRLRFTTPLEIYRDFIHLYHEKMFQFAKKHFEFNDVYPYLYVQLYFKGIKHYDLVQHFVLDEMQDYTPIQYAVLAKVFQCKRTIIGDFSQALLPFETVSKEAFASIFSNLEYVQLTTTYRSSYEIAMYAKKFMRAGEIHPIARHGEQPEEVTYGNVEQMVKLIETYANNVYKSTAIICKTEAQCALLQQQLTIPFTIIDGNTKEFTTGLLLTTIQYAKGLEFDAVVVPFVDKESYATEFDKGLLYIAASRAMHRLTMLVNAQSPSPLL